MYLTKGVIVWLVASSVIVIFDATYILNRPDTLPGGKYGQYFTVYQIYTQYDTLYGGQVKDYFADIIAYLNLAEVAVTFIGMLLSVRKNKKDHLKGAIWIIAASAFVFWKTIIYFWYDIQYMSAPTKWFAPDAIAFYYVPNSFWILCPLWTILSIGKRIGRDVLAVPPKPKKA
jgi:hypothetical protein